MRSCRGAWVRLLKVTGLAALVLAAAGAGGPRLVIEVDEPFVIQGQLCPAGVVSIQLVSRYNPTSTLQEVRVGARSLGVFRAEQSALRSLERRDAVLFSRDALGRRVLVGYTLVRGGTVELHRFSPPPMSAQLLARAGG